ncbi:Gfo/Idh/MocA family oxidoreductase [uncultured Phocaeicola sp.]|uniref:Gfo/Idh/MocA family oxidoreductase n=1 Tax=uncultured Phocaeicola sp. TaxID=990718 RepID=UPI0004AE35CF|nr:Gfo/Idh/MocA family oxidoreductase [Lachnospiraceae bacterium]MCX4343392.1 Gfo/Idh/MocA family oxidoreductase [Kineothrix sp.]
MCLGRRERFDDAHHIPGEDRYEDWRKLLDRGYELDGIIIATQDREHYEPAMAAIAKGYHILLEKPMVETAEKTKEKSVRYSRSTI